MERQIIDCCALINLYTGWGSLDPLKTLGLSLHISEVVLDESLYINELTPDGLKLKVPLNLHLMQSTVGYTVVRPETTLEINDYVDFAMEIDDGEAQSLSIAKHRNLILLTDDRKALTLAARPEVAVETCTTVQVLRMWSDAEVGNEERIPSILCRISELARFRPRVGTSDRHWWDGMMMKK